MPDDFTHQRETPFGTKGLKKLSPLTLNAQELLIDFTLSNARQFYLSKGEPLGTKGLKNYLL